MYIDIDIDIDIDMDMDMDMDMDVDLEGERERETYALNSGILFGFATLWLFDGFDNCDMLELA